MATTFDPRAIANGSITGAKIVSQTITGSNLALNAVTGATLRLANAEFLRARNFAGDDDVQIVRVNASDRIEFGGIPQFSGTPSAPTDAVNVSYLNARLEGLKPKESVKVATTAEIDLTTGGLLTIDGVSVLAGDRVLVKDQTTNPEENGIYIAAAVAWSRAADANAASELEGAYTIVREGAANGLKGWVQTALISVLDTDPVTFVQFSATTAMIGGDMITVSGATISVHLASTSGLESTNPGNDAGQLRIKLEASDATLKIDGSNQLGVNLDAARAITAGASGIGVNLEASNPSLKISGNELGIKFDPAGGLSKTVDGTKVNTDGVTTKVSSNNIEGLKAIEESFVLNNTDITTNKYIDLSHSAYGASGTVNSVTLCLAGFPTQQKNTNASAPYNNDYRVDLTGGSGGVTRIDWSGLGLDGFVIPGDKIIVNYTYL